MDGPGRRLRFAIWGAAVGAVFGAAAIARADIPHATALAGAAVLVMLSLVIWLLATTPPNAIRLPVIVSQVLVVAGTAGVLYLATGRIGTTPLIVGVAFLITHARRRQAGGDKEAGPGPAGPWRLVPCVWHPALWQTLAHPLNGAAIAIWLGAAAGSELAVAANSRARLLGMALWVAAGGAIVGVSW